MKLEIEYVNPKDLKPYENNAKQHPQSQIEQIKESIKQFGMNDPIAVSGEDNVIVEGHGRLMACLELGIESVPIIRLDDLSEEQRRAYGLVHNKLTMNSGFDLEKLNLELRSIDSIRMEKFDFKLNDLNPEKKDLSDTLEESFLIEIDCKDEIEQETLFQEFLERGLKCRAI